MQDDGELTIGQLGAAAGTKVETIRYYERIGLLAAPRRTSGNYRSYEREHMHQLAFIRRARELGFSIEDVRELLNLAGQRDNSCVEIDRLASRHLATVETKIASLKRLGNELRETLAVCKGGRVAECKVVQALSPDAWGKQPRSSRRSRRA
jgi:DNA-binding transcriptional MerR regulator